MMQCLLICDCDALSLLSPKIKTRFFVGFSLFVLFLFLSLLKHLQGTFPRSGQSQGGGGVETHRKAKPREDGPSATAFRDPPKAVSEVVS